jgi:7-cyano-7-deazaguanine synthase in queuosine biosynthesis
VPDAVALLSGGLDSFSGAVLMEAPGVFLSHTDNPTVTGAQRRAWSWLTDSGVQGERVQISLSEASRKRENTTRTRALLFYALAVALAEARGTDRVEVPENGFTSLNLSLGNDRGGALSTRSTHPWTMHLVQMLLDDAGIGVKLVNPYEWHTKGELVRAAAGACPAFADGLVRTLSCAKLDGRTYKGGNPNRNCGLCVACLTRRASIRAAGIEDKTPYLATTLTGASLDQLRSRREIDVRAVMSRIEAEIDEFTLLENGPYPDDFDLTAAAGLCRRGFAELAALLPELT